MPINFDALRSAATNGVPDDGWHTARLERARVVEIPGRGAQLVTEWNDLEEKVYWTCWDSLEDRQWMDRTCTVLDGLGVDREHFSDDNTMAERELDQALYAAEGKTFQVRTESTQGNRGGRWFTHAVEVGAATGTEPAPAPSSWHATANTREPVQTQLATDVPVPARDFTAPPEPVDDDDIPF